MPFSESDVPAELIAAVKRGDVVPLIGAGFSKQVDSAVPNWTELLAKFYDYAADQGHITAEQRLEIKEMVERGRFLVAAQELREQVPDSEYFVLIDQLFSDRDVGASAVHDLLWQLRPALVMTTNYDRFIENSYAKRFGGVPTVFLYDSAEGLQRQIQAGRLSAQPPMIFKLHGSIDRPDSIVLSEREYRGLIHRQPGYRLVLSGIFLTKVVLMLGFSGDDPELLRLLESSRDALKYQSTPDLAFMSLDPQSVQARRLRDDFGVRVIPYEATAGHPELVDFLRFLVDASGS